MGMDGTWTIGELAERAAGALAADGAAQVSGRVRDLPNTRLIRWYTTIGLVDPPLGRRGRTALYGHRHLLQLVAVKRRQAEGRSIAEIQLELAAAPNETLARIAALPATLSPQPPLAPKSPSSGPSTGNTADAPSPPQRSGGSATPLAGGTPQTRRTPTTSPANAAQAGESAEAADETAPPTDFANAAQDAETAGIAESAARRGASAGVAGGGAAPSDSPSGVPPGPVVGGAGRRKDFWSARPDVSYDRANVSVDYGRPLPPVVQGVRLAPGVTLLLDGPTLSGDDLAAIDAAARPLLDELRRRGHLTPAESPAFPPEAHSRRSP